MIKIKHFLDDVEADDGQRIWVEPIKLTKDLQEWCKVGHMLTHLAPCQTLWDWYGTHPDGYEYFRGRYHDELRHGPYRAALQQLACAARRENFTLLHESEDPERNTAAALHEFLNELEAYCPPDL